MKDLLIHCDVARPLEQCSLDIWDSLGAALYLPTLLFGWINWFRKHSSDVWNLMPACLMWLVWKERDSCMFEKDEGPLWIFGIHWLLPYTLPTLLFGWRNWFRKHSQMFGTSCRLVWCGWCGRKGIVVCLKMLRDPLINCNHCSSIHCLIGFGQGFLNFVVLFLTSITH